MVNSLTIAPDLSSHSAFTSTTSSIWRRPNPKAYREHSVIHVCPKRSINNTYTTHSHKWFISWGCSTWLYVNLNPFRKYAAPIRPVNCISIHKSENHIDQRPNSNTEVTQIKAISRQSKRCPASQSRNSHRWCAARALSYVATVMEVLRARPYVYSVRCV